MWCQRDAYVVQTMVSLLQPDPHAETAPTRPKAARRVWTFFILMVNDCMWWNECVVDEK